MTHGIFEIFRELLNHFHNFFVFFTPNLPELIDVCCNFPLLTQLCLMLAQNFSIGRKCGTFGGFLFFGTKLTPFY